MAAQGVDAREIIYESIPYRLLHQAREHLDGSPTSVAKLVEADASTGAGHDRRIRQRAISTRIELDCEPLSPLQHVVLDEYTTRIPSFYSPVPIAEPSFFAVEQAPPVEGKVDIRFLNEECLQNSLVTPARDSSRTCPGTDGCQRYHSVNSIMSISHSERDENFL